MDDQNHIQDKSLHKHYRWCMLHRIKRCCSQFINLSLKWTELQPYSGVHLDSAELLGGLFCLHLCCGRKGRLWFLFDLSKARQNVYYFNIWMSVSQGWMHLFDLVVSTINLGNFNANCDGHVMQWICCE